MQREWINPKKRRFYRVHTQRDLLGDITIVRCWGSLDSRHGNMKIEVLSSEDALSKTLKSIDKRRRKRGYVSVP